MRPSGHGSRAFSPSETNDLSLRTASRLGSFSGRGWFAVIWMEEGAYGPRYFEPRPASLRASPFPIPDLYRPGCDKKGRIRPRSERFLRFLSAGSARPGSPVPPKTQPPDTPTPDRGQQPHHPSTVRLIHPDESGTPRTTPNPSTRKTPKPKKNRRNSPTTIQADSAKRYGCHDGST